MDSHSYACLISRPICERDSTNISAILNAPFKADHAHVKASIPELTPPPLPHPLHTGTPFHTAEHGAGEITMLFSPRSAAVAAIGLTGYAATAFVVPASSGALFSGPSVTASSSAAAAAAGRGKASPRSSLRMDASAGAWSPLIAVCTAVLHGAGTVCTCNTLQ